MGLSWEGSGDTWGHIGVRKLCEVELVACMRILYVFLNMRVGRRNLTLGDVGAISGLSSEDLGYLRQF